MGYLVCDRFSRHLLLKYLYLPCLSSCMLFWQGRSHRWIKPCTLNGHNPVQTLVWFQCRETAQTEWGELDVWHGCSQPQPATSWISNTLKTLSTAQALIQEYWSQLGIHTGSTKSSHFKCNYFVINCPNKPNLCSTQWGPMLFIKGLTTGHLWKKRNK